MTEAADFVCGSGYPLTAKQRELLSVAESLGPAFAARAARYDREASFPFENYAELFRDEVKASSLVAAPG